MHELQRPLVGRQGFVIPVQAPQQFPASRVQVVVALQIETSARPGVLRVAGLGDGAALFSSTTGEPRESGELA